MPSRLLALQMGEGWCRAGLGKAAHRPFVGLTLAHEIDGPTLAQLHLQMQLGQR